MSWEGDYEGPYYMTKSMRLSKKFDKPYGFTKQCGTVNLHRALKKIKPFQISNLKIQNWDKILSCTYDEKNLSQYEINLFIDKTNASARFLLVWRPN